MRERLQEDRGSAGAGDVRGVTCQIGSRFAHSEERKRELKALIFFMLAIISLSYALFSRGVKCKWCTYRSNCQLEKYPSIPVYCRCSPFHHHLQMKQFNLAEFAMGMNIQAFISGSVALHCSDISVRPSQQ